VRGASVTAAPGAGRRYHPFSRQFGRASAPTIPHFVQTIRGPNTGTGTSSDHGSALKIALWWHCQHDTSSDRTLFARMLPSVIG
jgi:hypothetical protein